MDMDWNWPDSLTEGSLSSRLLSMRALSRRGRPGAETLLACSARLPHYPMLWCLEQCASPDQRPDSALGQTLGWLTQRFHDSRSREQLQQALQQADDPLEQLQTGLALIQQHRLLAIPTLLELLRQPGELADCAAFLLGRLGRAILPEWKQQRIKVRTEAMLMALWYLGPEVHGVAELLQLEHSELANAVLLGLQGAGVRVSLATRRAALWLDSSALELLAELVFSSEVPDRVYAVKALRSVGPASSDSAKLLSWLLRDPDYGVQLTALDGLTGHPSPGALAALLAAACSATDPLRAECRSAILSRAELRRPQLLACLDACRPEHRGAAMELARALAQQPFPLRTDSKEEETFWLLVAAREQSLDLSSSTSQLLTLLSSERWPLRWAACSGLVGTPEPGVVEALQGCLGDPVPEVTQAAARALISTRTFNGLVGLLADPALVSVTLDVLLAEWRDGALFRPILECLLDSPQLHGQALAILEASRAAHRPERSLADEAGWALGPEASWMTLSSPWAHRREAAFRDLAEFGVLPTALPHLMQQGLFVNQFSYALLQRLASPELLARTLGQAYLQLEGDQQEQVGAWLSTLGAAGLDGLLIALGHPDAAVRMRVLTWMESTPNPGWLQQHLEQLPFQDPSLQVQERLRRLTLRHLLGDPSRTDASQLQAAIQLSRNSDPQLALRGVECLSWLTHEPATSPALRAALQHPAPSVAIAALEALWLHPPEDTGGLVAQLSALGAGPPLLQLWTLRLLDRLSGLAPADRERARQLLPDCTVEHQTFFHDLLGDAAGE